LFIWCIPERELRIKTHFTHYYNYTKFLIMEGTIGEIRMFGGNFAPRPWAFCAGQLLPISQNTALFSILGTIYGGDGRTTFGLPDLRGRTAMSAGRGPGLSNFSEGQQGGTESATITVANLPSHNHPLNVSNAPGTSSTPVDSYPAQAQVQVERGGVVHDVNAYGSTTNSTMAPSVIGLNGGGTPVPIRNPYLAVYYIICLQGAYPSRS
jgi:microcystin-dependent protein